MVLLGTLLTVVTFQGLKESMTFPVSPVFGLLLGFALVIAGEFLLYITNSNFAYIITGIILVSAAIALLFWAPHVSPLFVFLNLLAGVALITHGGFSYASGDKIKRNALAYLATGLFSIFVIAIYTRVENSRSSDFIFLWLLCLGNLIIGAFKIRQVIRNIKP